MLALAPFPRRFDGLHSPPNGFARLCSVHSRLEKLLIWCARVSDVCLDSQDYLALIRFGRGAPNTAGSLEKCMIEDDLQGFSRHQRELGAEELSRARKFFCIAVLDGIGAGVCGCGGVLQDGGVDIGWYADAESAFPCFVLGLSVPLSLWEGNSGSLHRLHRPFAVNLWSRFDSDG